ncbi:MAG TPA: Maf family protein, partial [Bacteroidota bacterium]|nr:Maf family protein [Bacteroidota bacterium]
MLALKKPFILASGSPRRQHLLRQLGMPFEVRESGVDEQFDSTKTPAENVTMLAEHKAGAVAKTIPNGIILGADTTVVLHGAVLNKPEDAHDARRMLNELSGNTHTVFTGIALIDKPSGKRVAAVEQTEVTFRRLSQEEIREYVEAGSPMDKAGAYGIQDDYGATFVQKIDGCFYNVVGLPV